MIKLIWKSEIWYEKSHLDMETRIQIEKVLKSDLNDYVILI